MMNDLNGWVFVAAFGLTPEEEFASNPAISTYSEALDRARTALSRARGE